MGWLIIISAYLIVAFLVGTFLFTFAKMRYDADFSRTDAWGDRCFWRRKEYLAFWIGLSGLIWPLVFPVIVGLIIWKAVVPVFTAITKFWEYLIKEAQNPRENV